jgi:hypothetical protein
MATNPEPTRPLSNIRHESDGTLRATATLSPKACTTRASIGIPPNKVIPIIFVPGIMALCRFQWNLTSGTMLANAFS